MQNAHYVTGFCPKENKNIQLAVTYIFNMDSWEKGISELPCISPCENGCPVLVSAPNELKSI